MNRRFSDRYNLGIQTQRQNRILPQILLWTTLACSCSRPQLSAHIGAQPAASLCEMDCPIISAISPETAPVDAEIRLSGRNLDRITGLKLDNQVLSIAAQSEDEVIFSLPSGSKGATKVEFSHGTGQWFEAGTVYRMDDEYPIIGLKPERVCRGIRYYSSRGDLLDGTMRCSPDFSEFKPENVTTSVEIAGIQGTLSFCSKDGEQDCVVPKTMLSIPYNEVAAYVIDTSTVAGISGRAKMPSINAVKDQIKFGRTKDMMIGKVVVPSKEYLVYDQSNLSPEDLEGHPGIPYCTEDGQQGCFVPKNSSNILASTVCKDGEDDCFVASPSSEYNIFAISKKNIVPSEYMQTMTLGGIPGLIKPIGTYDLANSWEPGFISAITGSEEIRTNLLKESRIFGQPGMIEDCKVGNLTDNCLVASEASEASEASVTALPACDGIEKINDCAVLEGDTLAVSKADLGQDKIRLDVQIANVTGTVVAAKSCNENFQQGCDAQSEYFAAPVCVGEEGRFDNCYLPPYDATNQTLVAIDTSQIASSLIQGASLAGMEGEVPLFEDADPQGELIPGVYVNFDDGLVESLAGTMRFKDTVTLLGKKGTIPDCDDPDDLTQNCYVPESSDLFGGPLCSAGGEQNCVAASGDQFIAVTTEELAADANDKSDKFILGLVIAGIEGTLSPLCGTEKRFDCIATEDFPAMNQSSINTEGNFLTVDTFDEALSSGLTYQYWNSQGALKTFTAAEPLLAENIKSGVTIFNVTGVYPSSSAPLQNSSDIIDLTSGSFFSLLTDENSFEYFDSFGNRYLGKGDSDLLAENYKTGISLNFNTNQNAATNLDGVLSSSIDLDLTAEPASDRIVLSWDPEADAEYLLFAHKNTPTLFEPSSDLQSLPIHDDLLYHGSETTFVHMVEGEEALNGFSGRGTWVYTLYTYKHNAQSGLYFVSSRSQLSVSTINCQDLPGGQWVAIAGHELYGTGNFCIMKYEASWVDNAVSSVPGNAPMAASSFSEARNSCKNLGSNFDLISNGEWMTTAAYIAHDSRNWNNNVINRGYTNDTNTNPVAADGITEGDWSINRRYFHLPNNEVIWDFSGNAVELTSLYVDGNTGLKEHEKKLRSAWFADINPAPNSWTSANGVGAITLDPENNPGYLVRGGDFDDADNAGILSATLVQENNFSHIGFRCVKRLPSSH